MDEELLRRIRIHAHRSNNLIDHIALALRVGTYNLRDLREPVLREMNVEGDIGDCAICLEKFDIGDVMVPLPCNDTHPHRFHKDCIAPWVRTHGTCPVCRGKI